MKVKTQSKSQQGVAQRPCERPWVKLAQKRGLPCARCHKLKEIDEQFGLIRPGATVVDLGCTPGAWSQYVRRRLSPDGAASGAQRRHHRADILPMEPIEGVAYLAGDFAKPRCWRNSKACCWRAVDVVVSDMAPNLSGIASTDATRIAHLVELAVDFGAHLKPEGALVTKLFHGSGYSEALVQLFQPFQGGQAGQAQGLAR